MKAVLQLVGLGLLGVVAIRDDLKEQTLEMKDSAHPSALVEVKDAAKNKASSKSTGQTVARSGKGRHHHRHAPSEGHHHHRHKHHHHARRHHDDTDDESLEDDRAAAEDGSLDDDERAKDDDDRLEDHGRRGSRRKEPETDDEAEVDEDEQEWEDEEDEPPRLPRKHESSRSAKEDQEDFEEKRERAPSQAAAEPAKKVEQPVAAATTKMPADPIIEAAVAHSQPTAGPLDVLRLIWSWVLPCFGWTVVIALIVLVALRIKWPELSNVGVHYVARKMSLSDRKRKEAHETRGPEEAQAENEKPSAAVSA